MDLIDYHMKFVNENIVLLIFARISKNINKNISYEILLKYHIVSLHMQRVKEYCVVNLK